MKHFRYDEDTGKFIFEPRGLLAIRATAIGRAYTPEELGLKMRPEYAAQLDEAHLRSRCSGPVPPTRTSAAAPPSRPASPSPRPPAPPPAARARTTAPTMTPKRKERVMPTAQKPTASSPSRAQLEREIADNAVRLARIKKDLAAHSKAVRADVQRVERERGERERACAEDDRKRVEQQAELDRRMGLAATTGVYRQRNTVVLGSMTPSQAARRYQELTTPGGAK